MTEWESTMERWLRAELQTIDERLKTISERAAADSRETLQAVEALKEHTDDRLNAVLGALEEGARVRVRMEADTAEFRNDMRDWKAEVNSDMRELNRWRTKEIDPQIRAHSDRIEDIEDGRANERAVALGITNTWKKTFEWGAGILTLLTIISIALQVAAR